jgi:O-antigen ligase
VAESTTRVRRVLDLIGLGLIVAIVGWAYLVSRTSGEPAERFVSLILGVCATLVVARVLERYLPRSVPVLTLCVVAGFFVSAWLRTDAWGNPLDYANASAALAVLAVVSAFMLLEPGSTWLLRILLGVPGAVVFAVTPFLINARTAAILVVALLIAFVLGIALRWPRWGIVLAGVVLAIAILTTSWLGASYGRGSASLPVEVADSSLSEARLRLWQDAISIAADHPWTGVGWGGFATASPLARSDEDLRFAHNEFLQQAAESGFPGLLLTISLFGWGFARLYVSRNSSAIALLGALGLSAAGIAGSVDYVLRFPAVSLAVAALVGAAQAGRRDVRRRDRARTASTSLVSTGSKGSD